MSKVDKGLFWSRLKRIFDHWAKGGKPWGGGADAIIVNYGKANENVLYSRTSAIHLFLFGYEFPDTVLVLTKGKLTILCSSSKAKYLDSLGSENRGIKLEIMIRNKEDKNAANFAKLLKAIKGSNQGSLLGWIPSETQNGKFIARWNQAWQENGMKQVNVSMGFGRVISVKDAAAQKNTERAAKFAASVFKKKLIEDVLDALEENKVISHQKLSDDAAECFNDPIKWDKSGNLAPDDIEICYDPLIMSGGRYDLKASATLDDKKLDTGKEAVILCRMGARYRSFCSNLARTYFIEPSVEMEKNYGVLTQVFLACKKIIQPQSKISKIYETALGTIKRANRSLLPHFVGCGFGMGLEFREKNLVLNQKNHQQLKSGMVLNFSIGFKDLKDRKSGKPYAMQIADTYLVTSEEADGHKLLTVVRRGWENVAFRGNGDEDEDEDEELDTKQQAATLSHYERRRQNREKEERATREAAVREKEMRQLAKRKQEELLRRLAKDGVQDNFNEEKKFDYSKINSYKSVSDFPSQARPNQLYVDIRKETILVPIFKQLVPFHISTIRTVSKQEEGGNLILRLNFATPNMKFKSRNDYIHAVPQNKHFIQELTFKAPAGHHDNLERSYFGIQELRKRVKNRIKEKEDKRSIVVQKELRVLRGGGAKLRDLSVRPPLTRRKSTGVLEAHQNGLRFSSHRDGIKIDIIYENIKHAVFQKADNMSTEVRMHFELVNPIMAGKKKTNFFQFYVEVVQSSQDLGHGSRWHDRDGVLEEQEEKRRKRRYNKLFFDFKNRVSQISEKFSKDRDMKIEYEEPFKQIAFKGVPGKEQVSIIPTQNLLIALDDKPPFVLTIDEVDLAVMERCRFGLREFDITFVFKDFSKAPLSISAIPKKKLDSIKNWLRTLNILHYERRDAVNWKKLMNTIREDLKLFAENGGWLGYFDPQNDDDESDEEDPASEFSSPDEEEYSEEDDEYESASDEVDEEDDDDEYDEDSEEEGESWEQLAKNASEHDRRRNREDNEYRASVKRRRK